MRQAGDHGPADPAAHRDLGVQRGVLRRRPHRRPSWSSAGRATAGGWPGPRWPSSAAPPRSASRSASGASWTRCIDLARRTGAAGSDPLLRDRLARAWIGLQVMRGPRPGSAGRPAQRHRHRGVGGQAAVVALAPDLGELAMDGPGRAAMVARGAPYDLDEWQRLYLFSRADTIYGGSDEIQRSIIAEPGARPATAGPAVSTGAGAAGPAPPPGRDLLAGKVVVVTAAAGTGIGSAAARRCLAEGARVALSDPHERRLARAGGRAVPRATATGSGPRRATSPTTRCGGQADPAGPSACSAGSMS